MGAVYEVLHRDTQRRRAMKVLLPHVLADDDMRERFKREGIVTAGIESEHLVEVFDIGIDESTSAPFLIMELLRGEDLGARLSRRERTQPAEVLTIVEQIARALDRTHAAQVVHRDLKPENLFVTRRDDGSLRIKILDFGIAKFMDGVSRDTLSVGSPLYMAPEQTTGEALKITPATDLYALAQIVFTLLVGTPYFLPDDPESTNVVQLLLRVFQGVQTPATQRAAELGVELPGSFDAWFAKATALEPETRHQTAAELLVELRAALRDAPAELVYTSTQRGLSTPPPSREAEQAAEPQPRSPSTKTHVMARSSPVSEPTLGESGAAVRELPVQTSPQSARLPRRGALLGAGLVAVASGLGGLWAATRGSSPTVDSVASASEEAHSSSPPPPLATNPPSVSPSSSSGVVARTSEVSASATAVTAGVSAGRSVTPSGGSAARPSPPSSGREVSPATASPTAAPTVWTGSRR
jgi:serine/threonine-protein kinase